MEKKKRKIFYFFPNLTILFDTELPNSRSADIDENNFKTQTHSLYALSIYTKLITLCWICGQLLSVCPQLSQCVCPHVTALCQL